MFIALGILGSIAVGLSQSDSLLQDSILKPLATTYIEFFPVIRRCCCSFSFFSFGLPRVGLVLSSEACATIGLIFWAVPTWLSLSEAALKQSAERRGRSDSIGLRPVQVFYYVILPQAAAIALPSFSANVIF